MKRWKLILNLSNTSMLAIPLATISCETDKFARKYKSRFLELQKKALEMKKEINEKKKFDLQEEQLDKIKYNDYYYFRFHPIYQNNFDFWEMKQSKEYVLSSIKVLEEPFNNNGLNDRDYNKWISNREKGLQKNWEELNDSINVIFSLLKEPLIEKIKEAEKIVEQRSKYDNTEMVINKRVELKSLIRKGHELHKDENSDNLIEIIDLYHKLAKDPYIYKDTIEYQFDKEKRESEAGDFLKEIKNKIEGIEKNKSHLNEVLKRIGDFKFIYFNKNIYAYPKNVEFDIKKLKNEWAIAYVNYGFNEWERELVNAKSRLLTTFSQIAFLILK